MIPFLIHDCARGLTLATFQTPVGGGPIRYQSTSASAAALPSFIVLPASDSPKVAHCTEEPQPGVVAAFWKGCESTGVSLSSRTLSE